jgi:hypothetical protein
MTFYLNKKLGIVAAAYHPRYVGNINKEDQEDHCPDQPGQKHKALLKNS